MLSTMRRSGMERHTSSGAEGKDMQFTARGEGAALTRRALLALGGSFACLAAWGCRASSDETPAAAEEGAGAEEQAEPEQEEPTAEEIEAQKVEEVLQGLTAEQKVAQLFCVRPESLTGASAVTAADEAFREALAARPVGGICFFGKNLQDPGQTEELLAAVKSVSSAAAGLETFCCVDEEGGTVARIANNAAFGIANVGDMRDIGDAGDADAARSAAVTIGTYLKELGFTLDFAPDADICSNPESQTMARRSFGTTADVVAPMVAAQVEGFLSCGIGCCAKHFPGIGAATGDSETEPIVSEKTEDEMAEEELVPFQSAMAAGVPVIMVGHLSCPNITGTMAPASLSPEIVGGILRERLGFSGLIITDSLEMGAVAEDYTSAESALAAIKAGVDMVLMPADFDAAYAAVLDAVSAGDIEGDRLDDSVRRIIRAKRALAG